MKKTDVIKLIIAVAIVVIVGGVAFHSIGEIHYLKSFYPETFTVKEVFFATLVEWIKFLLTTVPLVLGWLLLKGFFRE